MSEFSFFPVPPEILAQMRQHQEHEHMHTQDNTHAVKQLLDELDEDQLQALDMIISHSSNPSTNGYFRGRIEMLLQYKFNVCPCGEEHDPNKEFAQEVGLQNVDNSTDVNFGKEGEEPKERLLVGTKEWHDKLEGYNLYVHHISHAAGDFELRCNGCEKFYPSIEDRMPKASGPEGCPGCIEKTKWG